MKMRRKGKEIPSKSTGINNYNLFLKRNKSRLVILIDNSSNDMFDTLGIIGMILLARLISKI